MNSASILAFPFEDPSPPAAQRQPVRRSASGSGGWDSSEEGAGPSSPVLDRSFPLHDKINTNEIALGGPRPRLRVKTPRRSSFPSLQPPTNLNANRTSVASLLSIESVPEDGTFNSSSNSSPEASTSTIAFPSSSSTPPSSRPNSRPNSSLSHHRISRTISSPTVPPASMLIRTTSPPPPVNGTGIRARTQSPRGLLVGGPRRAIGGALRSNTVGFPSAQSTIQRAAEGGVEEPHLHHHQFDPKGKGRDYEKSEDWPKISRKRDQIIREMWSSERVLASGLLVVTEHFMQPLIDKADTPEELLSKRQIGQIFSNIADIQTFSLTLLATFAEELPSTYAPVEGATPPMRRPPAALERSSDPPPCSNWSAVPASPSVTSAPPPATSSVPSDDATITPASAASLLHSINPTPSPSSDSTLRTIPSTSHSSRPMSLPSDLSSVPHSSPRTISKILEHHAPFFQIFHAYLHGYLEVQKMLAEWRREDPKSAFNRWLGDRESMERAAKQRLSSWLLLPVQRVPRWLMLIKELLKNTPEGHPERLDLEKACDSFDKICGQLNERLSEITRTQRLIGLHRSFTNIPEGFTFVQAGRHLLRQGDLLKVCRRRDENRTCWLFTDCFVYGTTNVSVGASATRSVVGLSSWIGLLSPTLPSFVSGQEPELVRSRTRSALRPVDDALLAIGERGKYNFHRKIDLEDLTALSVEDTDKTRYSFELLSPEKSFAVVCHSQQEKDEWLGAIRDAQADLLSSLRTLKTDEEATMRRHRRRSLQAIPFAPSMSPVPSLGRERVVSMGDSLEGSPRHSVESFIAPVWVPDNRAERCMRCYESFTVFKRRHHCRICGIIVCHACSTKQYKILDSANPTAPTVPVRACDSCFAATFPAAPIPPIFSSPTTRPASGVGAGHSVTFADSPDRPPSLCGSSSQDHSDASSPLTPASQRNSLPDASTLRPLSFASETDVHHRLPTHPSPPHLGTLKSAHFRDSFDGTTTHLPSGLATLRLDAAARSSLESAAVAADEFGSMAGVTRAPPPPAQSPLPGAHTHRRLSALNDRFSIFVGGGHGGPDWMGRGEISRSRFGAAAAGGGAAGGPPGGAPSGIANGEAAGKLRGMLREERARLMKGVGGGGGAAA